MRTVFTNGKIFTGSEWLNDKTVWVENGRIHSIAESANWESAGQIDLKGNILAPAFMDIQVYGGNGFLFSEFPSVESVRATFESCLAGGPTHIVPTVSTNTMELMLEGIQAVKDYWKQGGSKGVMGVHLEGPWLNLAKKGAHNPTLLLNPADVPWSDIEPLVDGLTVMTVAPEIPGGLELIRRLTSLGVRISIGHSGADLAGALAGYDAGGMTTTHLFNGMTGIDHYRPGVAVAALTRDEAWVELIADGHHVHPALWPLIARLKPVERLLLVSDAIALAGTGDGRVRLGGLDVEVIGGRATLAGTTTLAGSVIALDTAVRNLVAAGAGLPAAVAAAGRNPLALLGIDDRGRIAPGLRADLVELDGDLRVRRVMRAGEWFEAAIS